MRRVVFLLTVILLAGALVGVAGADQTGDGTPEDNASAIDVAWERTYDQGGGREVFHDAVPAGDGYLLVGTAELGSYGSDRWDGWLVRIGPDGAIEWERTMGGSGAAVLTEVVALEEGYLVGGMANGSSRFGGGSNQWLVRIGPAGDLRWSRVYRSAGGWDRVEGLAATGDGQALAVGGSTAMRVAPTDGEVRWRRPYASVVTGVASLDDGFALGGTSAAESDVLDGWLGRIDGDGSLRWSEHYVRTGFNRPEALAATTDGGFVLGGRTDAEGTSELPAWVVGTDASGEVAWERRLRDPTIDGWIYGMAAARENHVAVAGKSIPGAGWVVLLDGEGETVAEHGVGEVARSVVSLGDGDFLAVGASGGDDATVHAFTYPALEAPPETETADANRSGTTSTGLGAGFAASGALLSLLLAGLAVAARRR